MTRSGLLALLIFGAGSLVIAQTNPGSQPNTSVQAQSSTSASASASHENQGGNTQKGSKNTPPTTSRSASGSSSTSVSAGGGSASIASGTAIQAELMKPLDSRHSKPGDSVVARTTQDVKQDGRVVLKKGSELTGRVTQAEARSSGSRQSSLGIVFDHCTPKNGHPMPLNLSLEAIAAAANQTSASLADDQLTAGSAGQGGIGAVGTAPAGGGMARGGPLSGVGGTVGGVANTTGAVAGNVGQTASGTVGAATHTVASAGGAGGLNAAGQLTSGSSGVFNLPGLNLTSAVTNGTSASVISSAGRNVHLDSGTQMLLGVMSQ